MLLIITQLINYPFLDHLNFLNDLFIKKKQSQLSECLNIANLHISTSCYQSY